MLSYWTKCFALGSTIGLQACSFLEPSPPNFDLSVRSAAVAYLNTLPPDQEIMVWPSGARAYSVLEVGAASGKALVDEYIRSRQGPFHSWPVRTFSNVTVAFVSVASDPAFREAVVAGKDVWSPEREFILDIGRSGTGCAAIIETSRNTWIDSGGAVVAEDIMGEIGTSSMRDCVYAVLDFINGFPTPGNEFSLEKLPGADVRNAVMWAFRVCSREDPPAGVERERTRDGVSPFPSIQCAMDYLA